MKQRKKYQKQEDTPEQLHVREKRKWQINLRRYVLEQNPCIEYAPYFGLDSNNMRSWFQYQFSDEQNWDNFGQAWQFDHLVPVAYFDYHNENDMKLCWNFTNLRVESILLNKNRGHRLDVLAAKSYFQKLYDTTGYFMCRELLEKINSIQLSEFVSTQAQQEFINTHKDYLEMIQDYSSFEFELLNSGRTVEQVNQEVNFLKNFKPWLLV